ncbi:MAG: hypothetical protein B6D55_02395 [Candidatus Omnitrophica bacterium 4484_70.2]|nr:MAG: hypothetical protein B6D55_02395 [Candidatus Omnitrophica bacterium 4484_70.2]
MKGSYLKHVKYSLRTELNKAKALKFTKFIASLIGAEITAIKSVNLPPGFEIIAFLKESYIALNFWPEIGLCIIDIFSCKNFDNESVLEYIRKFFDKNLVKERVILDKTIFEETRELEGV